MADKKLRAELTATTGRFDAAMARSAGYVDKLAGKFRA